MKNNKWIWPIITLVAAISLGYFFGSRLNADEKFVPIVKTYKIPPERTGEARHALQSLFKDYDKASVGTLDNGLLVVRIPQSLEKGLDDMMARFQELNAQQNQRVKMDYWLVRGVKAENPQPISKELSHLNDALGIIQQEEGSMGFELIEHLTSQNGVGSKAKVRGMVSSVSNVVSQAGDKINIGLRYSSDFGEVEANAEVNKGDFVVVGQSNARKKDIARAGGMKHENSNDIQGTEKIFYIVRGTVIE